MTDRLLTGAELKAFHAHAKQNPEAMNGWAFEDFSFSVDGIEQEMDELKSKCGNDLAGVPDAALVEVRAAFLETLQLLQLRKSLERWRAANGNDPGLEPAKKARP